jgi:hypothetical protein
MIIKYVLNAGGTIPRPDDGGKSRWDEETLSWAEVIQDA